LRIILSSINLKREEEKMKIIRKLLDAVKSEKGQTMIEYALVVVLISIVLVFIFKGGGDLPPI